MVKRSYNLYKINYDSWTGCMILEQWSNSKAWQLIDSWSKPAWTVHVNLVLQTAAIAWCDGSLQWLRASENKGPIKNATIIHYPNLTLQRSFVVHRCSQQDLCFTTGLCAPCCQVPNPKVLVEAGQLLHATWPSSSWSGAEWYELQD